MSHVHRTVDHSPNPPPWINLIGSRVLARGQIEVLVGSYIAVRTAAPLISGNTYVRTKGVWKDNHQPWHHPHQSHRARWPLPTTQGYKGTLLYKYLYLFSVAPQVYHVGRRQEHHHVLNHLRPGEPNLGTAEQTKPARERKCRGTEHCHTRM